LNPADGAKAAVCLPVKGDDDHLAVVGTNRKLLIFPLTELPEMTRGKGVILQRYKTGGKLADIKALRLADGLTWTLQGGRNRTEANVVEWLGKRASAGRLPPNGFPRPPRFT
jgi:topoisomerase-4 subunit A